MATNTPEPFSTETTVRCPRTMSEYSITICKDATDRHTRLVLKDISFMTDHGQLSFNTREAAEKAGQKLTDAIYDGAFEELEDFES
jgi:hypothetical protein